MRDYDAELRATAARIGADAVDAVAKGRVEYASQLQRLVNLNVFLRYLVERDIPSAAPKGVRILYGKLTDLTSGITSLLLEGYPGPAASVFRSLLETAAHLQLVLASDVASRSKLFEDFILVQRSQAKTEGVISAERLAQNAEELAAVRDRYHPKYPHSWCWSLVPSERSRKGVPDNPNLREVCVAIEKPHYYDDLYGHLSDAVHPTPGYEMWMRDAEKVIQLNPKFSHFTRMTASLSTLLVLETLLTLLREFRPEDYADMCGLLHAFLPENGLTPG